MSAFLTIVGLGPGSPDMLTVAAQRALNRATDVIGYQTYVARVPVEIRARRHITDNREELDRARFALDLAQQGLRPVIVSGGDAGVFGMAAAVFDVLAEGPDPWREIQVDVVPGVSAVLAAAARVGAPLGNDFCVMSLSDNLKPWSVIEKRLRLAAEAGFVIALYNPGSKARHDQLDAALSLLRGTLSPETVVVFARAVTRPNESVKIVTLGAARGMDADMSTLIFIGCASTRCLTRPNQRPWVFTSRRVDPV